MMSSCACSLAPVLVAALVAIGVGCASAIPPIRLHGESRELDGLIGRWSGEYVGDRVGTRRGTIFFQLEEGEDHAHGDVLMTPEGADEPFVRHPAGAPPRDPDLRRTVRYLSVRFVALDDGTITGALDPYWDPDRGDEATTTFRGRLDGDIVRGTFVTRYVHGGESTTGIWVAGRQK